MNQEQILLILLILSAMALCAGMIAAVGAWRRAGHLRRLEERFAADLERLRGTFETELRDAVHAMGRAQSEMTFQLLGRLEDSHTSLLGNLGTRFREMQQVQGDALATSRRSQDERLDHVDAALKQFTGTFHKAVGELGEKQAEAFRGLQQRMVADLTRLRLENETKLEQIRATVDEKLHSTLETRLGQSFKLVSERLEQVHQGLGEMQALASGVGDLKRVLTNVRSRGTFGEVQLEALLEQVLSPIQYEKNVVTVPGSRERVEFAIRLPGRDEDGSVVHLPVDAKFPQEDYLRLQEAYEAGDQSAVEASRRALRTRFLGEASSISAKYLEPPYTTEFALLFVPTEGLYAEALRLPGLVEAMQRDAHVVLVGPSTLYAVLNSLQMGFHTLAIEKRSSEVWKILAAVKTEFGKFGQSLAEVKKKLREASNKIEFSERRSRVMEQKLREVETLPEGDAAAFLPELKEREER